MREHNKTTSHAHLPHSKGRCLKALALALLAYNGSAVSAQSTGVLEEVIVTAQKRVSSLQDTPIAMSALSGEDLELAQINNAMDLQMAVPNMSMTQTNFSRANITIRGIGNNAVSSASDSGTGVHFNGVYLQGSMIFESEFYDTERVEVLRGPQGTLYGRNTTAGVINVISKKPTDEFGGDIQLQAGNFNSIKAKGAINIPITDNLFQRFSGFYLERDGYAENIYLDEDIDGRDMYSLRSSTLWNIGESTEAQLVINYFNEDSNRMITSGANCTKDLDGILGCLPGNPGRETTNSKASATGALNNFLGVLTGLKFPEDDYANSSNPSDLRKSLYETAPIYQAEETIVSLEINHDFENYQLTVLGGFHQADYEDFYSPGNVASEPWPLEAVVNTPFGTFTSDHTLSFSGSNKERESKSLELRLASDYGGNLEFLAGAFYLDYELENNLSVYASSFELLGELLGAPPVFEVDEDPYELESWALFGELYYDITDNTKLTFGLRYTEEEKWNRSRTVFLGFLDNPNDPDAGYSKFNGDWSETTGKFNITHHLNDDIMLYGTLARSYKSGGFNPISSESPLLEDDPSLAFFDPEYINSFEMGVKSRLFDNHLQANLSYFFYDYDGMQTSKFVEQVSLNENVDAKIQGLEMELLFALDEHWQFGLDAAWLDTEIKDFATADPANPNQMGTTEGIISTPTGDNLYLPCGCQGIEADLDGNAIPNSPEFSVNLTASYLWTFNSGMSMRLGTNYYWQDTFYTRTFNAPQDELDSWEVWNANAVLTSAGDTWWAEAWVRNINDEDYYTGQFQAAATQGLATVYFLLEPRTYGMTVGYRF